MFSLLQKPSLMLLGDTFQRMRLYMWFKYLTWVTEEEEKVLYGESEITLLTSHFSPAVKVEQQQWSDFKFQCFY